MAITFFGVASTPADSATATNTADPTAVTPPGSMLSGDLVVMYGQRRGAGLPSISNAGGQSWTTLSQDISGTATLGVTCFTCIFNGTWSVNPSISYGATTCNTAVMLVFRPSAGSKFVLDPTTNELATTANGSLADFAAAASKTWNGYATQATSSVAVAAWFTDDDNTWGTLTGSGWSKTSLSAQYRNTSGSDQSCTFAYNIQSSMVTLANVTQTELTLGNDGGCGHIIVFYETPFYQKATNVNQSVNRANTY
jgi:hypothetical protein